MPYDDPDPARLGDLLHAVFRRLRRRWAEQLAPFGLTPHQFRALDALAGRPGGRGHGPDGNCRHGGGSGSLRVKDLADALRIAPRSATEVVDLLEHKELVERVPDPSDRRATLVALTPRGAALREQVRADRRRGSEEYFSRLAPEDRVELERLLRLLTADGPAPD
ncbi:MarR family transcriptional regulator [Kocuria aegyptia]|uniref:HTH marR-type domain-containing protein n=1 Tax=Kocuria aegyptia TaxID=330943 RepID=A0ABP4XA36_9MICC